MISGLTFIMHYYSAINKNKTLPFMATWIDLENIMLSEIRQKKCYMFHLYVELREKKSKQTKQNKIRLIEIETKGMVSRGGGVGAGEK